MEKLSWSDPHKSGTVVDFAYEELCENSTPSDFYFCAKIDEQGFCMVAIVPKLYFRKNGFMWDQGMYLNHILPDDLSESMECIWENDGDRTVEEIRQDLLKRGFEENMDFTTLVNGDYE